MAVVKMTLPFVRSVKPEKVMVNYFDENLSCFALRVYPSGVKTFSIKYRNKYGQQRFFKIGSFPIITLEEARDKAKELLRDIDLGGDPAKKKHADKNVKTVSELCNLYLEKGLGDKKASTIMNDKSRIERHIKPLIGNEPITTLTRGQIEDMMLDIMNGGKIATSQKSGKPRGKIIIKGGKEAAIRTTQLLGAILQFGVKRELLMTNPAYGIKKPKSTIRDVYLTLEDLELLGQTLNDPKILLVHKTAVDAIKLLLLTGCRKSEILTLKWDYIDFKNQIFRFPDTKTGKQNRPFGRGALHLLQELKSNKKSDWVFPAHTGPTHLNGLLRIFKKIQETKDENGNFIFIKKDVGLHTLRHTFATIAHDELGYSDLTIAGLIGHHVIRNTTNRYTHLVDKSQIQAADTISLKIATVLGCEDLSNKIINISKGA